MEENQRNQGSQGKAGVTTYADTGAKTEEIPAIHTYETDIKGYAERRGSTYASIMAAAAQKKKTGELEIKIWERPYFNIIVTATAAVLVIVVVLSGYFLFYKSRPTAFAPAMLRAPQTLIRADHETVITTEAGNTQKSSDALKQALAVPQMSGEFTYLPLKISENGTEKFAGSTELLKYAGVVVPANVAGNLTAYGNLGVIDTLGENETLFLAPIADYESAFAAMLRWEKTLPANYAKALPAGKNTDIGKNVFQDIVIKNNDTRSIKNVENEIILTYTIFNRKILIIASSQSAMEIALGRLIASPPTL